MSQLAQLAEMRTNKKKLEYRWTLECNFRLCAYIFIVQTNDYKDLNIKNPTEYAGRSQWMDVLLY